jgi:hypothetical protein
MTLTERDRRAYAIAYSDVGEALRGPARRTWRLIHYARPWTTNGERRMHHLERARLAREWRHAFATMALAEDIPRLERVVVTAMPVLANRRSRPDVGACLPAVKAGIDGLVDAGIVPDDDPDHVLELRFVAPAIGDRDSLALLIEAMP